MNKLYFLLIGLFIFSFSCKTKKKVIDTNNKVTIEEVNSFKVLDSLNLNPLKYNTLLMKFSASMKSGQNEMSTVGTLKVLKDSMIMISITPVLGIELMRMRITKTEIVILNRINKTYYLEGIENLDKLFGINLNYHQIQSILLNQLFTYPDSLDFRLDYSFKKFAENDSVFSLFSHKGNLKESNTYLHNIMIDANTNTYSNFDFELIESMKRLEVFYGNFQNFNSVSFPKLVQINLQNNNSHTSFSVEILKIEADKDLNFAFSVPSKYTKKNLANF